MDCKVGTGLQSSLEAIGSAPEIAQIRIKLKMLQWRGQQTTMVVLTWEDRMESPENECELQLFLRMSVAEIE